MKEKIRRNALCYLRTQRRTWGLTQRELASLIGLTSGAHISRIEHGKRAPTVEVAFACQVIFGIPPSAMFPQAYALVEEKVMRNIYRFHLQLGNATDLSGMRKRELCAQILKRATNKSNHLPGI